MSPTVDGSGVTLYRYKGKKPVLSALRHKGIELLLILGDLKKKLCGVQAKKRQQSWKQSIGVQFKALHLPLSTLCWTSSQTLLFPHSGSTCAQNTSSLKGKGSQNLSQEHED